MNKLNNLFEKKILYVNLIGLLFVILLLLSGKFYYRNYLGELKLYTDYISYLCGFISFLFFIRDSKFKFKYWIFMVICNYILSFCVSLFIGMLIINRIINIQTSIFLIYSIINILVFPFLYKKFKNLSYKYCEEKIEL